MTLYIVGTPIGNLEDITLRAIRILEEVDFVIAENPNHTIKLLNHLGIKKQLVKIDQRSKAGEIAKAISRLQGPESAAFVSDAGTPNLADPGGELVEKARLEGVAVVPIPGVSAVTALLSVTGIPADAYIFVGFLPKKKGRATLITELSRAALPIIFFESPMRIAKTLAELRDALGKDRRVVMGRELTKVHEELISGTLAELSNRFADQPTRGEIVFMVDTN